MKNTDFENSKYQDFMPHLENEENGRLPDILALEQELRSDEEHPTSIIGGKSDEHDGVSFVED